MNANCCVCGKDLERLMPDGAVRAFCASCGDHRTRLHDLWNMTFQAMDFTEDQLLEFHDAFETIVDQAKMQATINLPLNYGDQLIKQEKCESAVAARLALLRADGVTDLDIRTWWNMYDLDRRLMLYIQDLLEMALFLKLTQGDGLSKTDALIRLRKHRPSYGEPCNTQNRQDDDRPLPFELRDRINASMGRRGSSDLAELRHDLDHSTSFNSFVRREMRLGRI